VELKNRPHPADVAAFIELKEYDDKTIQTYTDGSKNKQGFGAGVTIFLEMNSLQNQNTSWITDVPIIKRRNYL
jgi:hypothetical protein